MEEIVKKVLFSNEQIVKRCEEIGEQISKEYKDKKPILIGLLKGSVPFLAELLKHIKIDCQIDFMDVSSYDGGLKSSGHVRIIKDLDTSIHDRDLIIVEDIIDSGLTLSTITKLLDARDAKSIAIACLLNKETERVANIDIKYTGFKIKNEFVIGFGLDYDELYRNLPYIGVVDTSKL